MGQYYKPVAIEQNEFNEIKVIGWVYSHDYKNGLKLMEHSWIGNNFMNVVEGLLSPGGAWYKKGIVWAGDYADKEPGTEENLYFLCEDGNKLNPEGLTFTREIPADKRYILNHTKKMYVDKTKVPVDSTYEGLNYIIHPLSLLTSEGNGQGGGDYFGKDPKNLVGSWARHIISIEGEVPAEYTELTFDLTEG
jgi:hypothetical protein